jgi:hypothetical protein
MTQDNTLDKKPEPKSGRAILLLGPFSFLMICVILGTAMFVSVSILEQSINPSGQYDFSYFVGMLDGPVIIISAILAMITLPTALIGIILYLTIWRSDRNKLINRLMILGSVLVVIGAIGVIWTFIFMLEEAPGLAWLLYPSFFCGIFLGIIIATGSLLANRKKGIQPQV